MNSILFSLLAVVFFATPFVVSDVNIAFSRNVTGSVSNNGWQYRATNLASWDLGALGSGVYYSSLGVAGANKTIDADSLWGAAQVTIGSFPISYLAYWDLDVNFDGSSSWFDIDVSSTAGFVAHSYVLLVEKDTNGNVVNTAGLDEDLFKLTYALTEGSDATSGLKWSTLAGTSTDGWTIDITYVLSNVVGVIGYGDAFVGPKSLESIINIQNWPYASTANTLSLVMGVGTGNVAVSGNVLLSNPNTKNQVYFRASGQATVDGSVKGVGVTYTGTSDYDTYFSNPSLQAQLSDATKGNYTLQIVTATFPAGAKNILYDPSVGAGQPVQDSPQGSTAVVVIPNFVALFVLLVCVFL